MMDTLARIKILVAEGKVRVSDHGYDEFADDDILTADVLDGVQLAIVVEDYPEKARAFSFFNRMPPASPYMSFGAFQRATKSPPLW